jgi:hypothetical protein
MVPSRKAACPPAAHPTCLDEQANLQDYKPDSPIGRLLLGSNLLSILTTHSEELYRLRSDLSWRADAYRIPSPAAWLDRHPFGLPSSAATSRALYVLRQDDQPTTWANIRRSGTPPIEESPAESIGFQIAAISGRPPVVDFVAVRSTDIHKSHQVV